MLLTKTKYSKMSELIYNDLLKLQRLDIFITERQYKKAPTYTRSGSERYQKIGPDGFLRFKDSVYIPAKKAIRSEMIYIYYNTDFAGHFRANKIFKLIRRKYFWPSLKKDIKDYIRSCPECQRGKPRRHRLYSKLVPISIFSKS